jgi:hypothetical protein
MSFLYLKDVLVSLHEDVVVSIKDMSSSPGTTSHWLYPKTPRYGRLPLVAYGWGTIHPIPGNKPTSTSRRGTPTNLKRTNRGDESRRHSSALPSDLGRGPEPPHAQGLPVMDKHRLFQAAGGVGLMHRPRWDIAVGTYVYLALHT